MFPSAGSVLPGSHLQRHSSPSAGKKRKTRARCSCTRARRSCIVGTSFLVKRSARSDLTSELAELWAAGTSTRADISDCPLLFPLPGVKEPLVVISWSPNSESSTRDDSHRLWGSAAESPTNSLIIDHHNSSQRHELRLAAAEELALSISHMLPSTPTKNDSEKTADGGGYRRHQIGTKTSRHRLCFCGLNLLARG